MSRSAEIKSQQHRLQQEAALAAAALPVAGYVEEEEREVKSNELKMYVLVCVARSPVPLGEIIPSGGWMFTYTWMCMVLRPHDANLSSNTLPQLYYLDHVLSMITHKVKGKGKEGEMWVAKVKITIT